MEVSDKNMDAKSLGFKDNENAIFIDEHNYKNRFEEFLKTSDDSKWEKIANKGRQHTMTNLTNDKAVESLIELMEEVIYSH
jgi:predicted RNA-binding protein Jag